MNSNNRRRLFIQQPAQGVVEQGLLIAYKVSQELAGLTGMLAAGLSQLASKGYGGQVRVYVHVKKLVYVFLWAGSRAGV